MAVRISFSLKKDNIKYTSVTIIPEHQQTTTKTTDETKQKDLYQTVFKRRLLVTGSFAFSI